MKKRKAQQSIGMSFGMIFAIFLIIVFLIVAFIVVNNFLDFGKCASVGQFWDNFQDKVDEAYFSQESQFVFDVNLPNGIEQICFANLSMDATNQLDYEKLDSYIYEEANVFLLPVTKACDMEYKFVEHLNINEIVKDENPYCVDVEQGLKIKKGFYDKSVIVQ